MYEDKLPPYSIEAEEAVLGSILLDPAVMPKLSLEADAFFVEKNRRVYETCLKLHREGTAIDQLTVAHEGGVDGLFLAQLINNTPTSLHAEYYAGILLEMRSYRKLIQCGNLITTLGYSKQPLEETLKAAREAILTVELPGKRPPLRTPKEIGEMGYDRYIELRMGNDETLLPTGFYDLDAVLGGLRRGEMTILAARPGLGKSTLAWDIARHVSRGLAKNVLWCSAEMMVEQILDREVASHIGQPIQVIWKGKYNEDVEHDILDAIGVISEQAIYLVDGVLTTDAIRDAATEMKARYGLAVIFVDYLQLLADRYGASENARISYISRTLKDIAKEIQVPVVVISQLNRGPEGRIDRRPRLSDLRDSGSIEQDADVVLFMYREDYYYQSAEEYEAHHPGRRFPKGICDVMIAKHRQGQSGVQIKLVWQEQSHRYANMVRR
jgi:replicative DNA helicase